MSRPGARVPSSALYICPTALHTAFYSVVQCYWTYALSLVWQGRIGRSEAHSAMLESRHRRDGPISLTTAVEADRRPLLGICPGPRRGPARLTPQSAPAALRARRPDGPGRHACPPCTVAPPLLGVVRVVDIAVARVPDRYTLTGRTS